jgi:hypothetical protein
MKRAAYLLFLTAGLLGCSTPTQLVAVVDSDYAPGTELRRVEVEVVELDTGRAPSLQSFEIAEGASSGASQVSLPFSFGIVARDPSIRVEVTATGYDPSGAVLVRRLARTGFLEGKRLQLTLFLGRACETVYASCEAMDETCLAGECISTDVPPAELTPVEPGQELRDAGRPDAPADTSVPTDTAVPTDTSVPTDGGECTAGLPCDPPHLPCYSGVTVCAPALVCQPDMVRMSGACPPSGTCNTANRGCSYRPPLPDALDDAVAGDRVGSSVALEGGWAVAGAPGANAVFAFRQMGGSWVRDARITPPTSAAAFGWDVALSGSWLAVGAHNTDDGSLADAGAVFVYELVGDVWTFRERLTAPSPAANGYFGHAVALDGNHLVASETGRDRVHVFQHDGSSWVAHGDPLTAVDERATGNPLGLWLDIHGDYVAVSRVFSGLAGAQVGQVYVFEITGGAVAPPQTIVPDVYADELGNGFGMGVAFDSDGDLVVVRYNGTVHTYVLLAGTWEEVSETPIGGGNPGWRSAAASDGLVAVGEPTGFDLVALFVRSSDDSEPMFGSYFFDDGGGVIGDDEFGYDVALSSQWLMIGAPRQEYAAGETGTVYFFDLDAS